MHTLISHPVAFAKSNPGGGGLIQSLIAQLAALVLNPGTKYVLRGESGIVVINGMGLGLFFGLKWGWMDGLSAQHNTVYALHLSDRKQQRTRCSPRKVHMKHYIPPDKTITSDVCDMRTALHLALPLVHAPTAHPWM